MSVLRLILGDQLTPQLAALRDLDPAADTVLLAEVRDECTYVRHHKKKIVLVLSAMRHFARALCARGVRVRYVALDDPANTGSLRGEMLRAVTALRPDAVVVTEAGEWRLRRDMQGWATACGLPVDIRDDDRFLCNPAEFAHWQAQLDAHAPARMEFFYRAMRRRYGLLMRGDQPEGDRWNFDRDNRRRLPAQVSPPQAPGVPPDAITQDVMALVSAQFPDHWGAVDGFDLPVTRTEAERLFADFLRHRLPHFGDWQDAMRTGAPVLFHSLISTAMNLGLLDPLTVCRAVEAAYRAGNAPLNAAEGYIRQILGWREFVRAIYLHHGPEYGTRNALAATRALPWFYWSGETRMNCIHQVVTDTRARAHAHHIQRLMITGNFALLAGLHPDAVDEWYMIVFADAYEWVEQPNTRGMVLHADGGVVGSKPYAASGAYINRMSDYCRGCAYDVRETLGERACPFNALYWDFLARHRDRFADNTRMAGPLRNLDRMGPERMQAIRTQAADFLARMEAGEPV